MIKKYFTLFMIILLVINCESTRDKNIPTYQVKRGHFIVSITETGELKATRSTLITAPSISWRFGEMKITYIIDDGTVVQQGDTLVLFDQAEVQKNIIDATAELDIARAEYEKMSVDQQSKIDDLEAEIRMAEISFEITKIELEQSIYEADIKKKEIQLQLNQAEIALQKAKNEVINQKQIHVEELQKQKIKMKQLKANLQDAYDTLSKLTLTAPTPGIVIVEENWTSDNKWQVGDQAWAGWPIISLPDLSEIKAMTAVNELDISRIRLEQMVRLRLDAFPDTTFTGKIISIATLATEKDDKSKIKVFPVEILVAGVHRMLMPGMTVSCAIIVQEVDNVLTMPIDALFTNEDKDIAYVAQGNSFKAREILCGIDDHNFVIIEKGLKEGETVALTDPTKGIAVEKKK